MARNTCLVAVAPPLARNMSAAPKIVVVGASGYVGKATIAHLVKHADPKTVSVVTRNPGSPTAEEYKALGVHVVAGDLASPGSLAGPFTGATSVYIIVPGTEVGAALGGEGLGSHAGSVSLSGEGAEGGGGCGGTAREKCVSRCVCGPPRPLFGPVCDRTRRGLPYPALTPPVSFSPSPVTYEEGG